MDAWIRFMAGVSGQTAHALMHSIDKRLSEGADHLHLLLSSSGGSVFHGLSVYNFLRGLGVKVSTYNFGSVDSIGVVIFCAGDHRVCVPHSRFHIHGLKWGGKGEFSFDEQSLEEQLKLLQTDYTNVAGVIAARTGNKVERVMNDMNDKTSLLPDDAREYGLIHEVEPQLIPAGAGMTVIYENAAGFEYSAPDQQPLPMPDADQPGGNDSGAEGSMRIYSESPNHFTSVSSFGTD